MYMFIVYMYIYSLGIIIPSISFDVLHGIPQILVQFGKVYVIVGSKSLAIGPSIL